MISPDGAYNLWWSKSTMVCIRYVALTALPISVFLFASSAMASAPRTTCDNSTLSGNYVYSYGGFTGGGNISIRFVVSGNRQFNGDGTLQGISSKLVEQKGAPKQTTFTGTYTIQPNCMIVEIDTDGTGAVTHFEEFTSPSGDIVSFVENDSKVVATGSESKQ